MNLKAGDIVYGYCCNHKIWDYMKISDIYKSAKTCFGWSTNHNLYYQFKFKDIVPKEIVESPLFKLMRELEETKEKEV